MIQPTSSNPRLTVLVIAIGFGVIFFLSGKEWMLWSALAVGVAGGLSVYLARKIDFVWMKIAWLLSFIVPNVLLTVVYFLILVPIAVLSRTFGSKDPMDLRNQKNSLFKTVDKEFDASSFENPW